MEGSRTSLNLLKRTLAEDSFAEFVKQAWPVLEPKPKFLPNYHIDLISEHLEALASGQTTRLIVNCLKP